MYMYISLYIPILSPYSTDSPYEITESRSSSESASWKQCTTTPGLSWTPAIRTVWWSWGVGDFTNTLEIWIHMGLETFHGIFAGDFWGDENWGFPEDFFGIQATTGGFNPSKNILSARPLSNWDPSHGWVEICRQFSDTPRFETTKQFWLLS